MKSPLREACRASGLGKTKVIFSFGEAGSDGASEKAAASPGNCLGCHWTGSLAGGAAGAAEASGAAAFTGPALGFGAGAGEGLDAPCDGGGVGHKTARDVREDGETAVGTGCRSGVAAGADDFRASVSAAVAFFDRWR